MINLAIFASGTGSNAQKIIEHFNNVDNYKAKVVLIVCNNANAGVLQIAKQHQIETLLIDKEIFFKTNSYTEVFKKLPIDFIVLAGFLWKVPASIIQAYQNKIINIHPALLPKFGGKGMYGHLVHEAVITQQEKESGITIHYVNEHYDEGHIIFQAKCKVEKNDTPESLAKKIHSLEYEHFARVIEQVLIKLNSKDF